MPVMVKLAAQCIDLPLYRARLAPMIVGESAALLRFKARNLTPNPVIVTIVSRGECSHSDEGGANCAQSDESKNGRFHAVLSFLGTAVRSQSR